MSEKPSKQKQYDTEKAELTNLNNADNDEAKTDAQIEQETEEKNDKSSCRGNRAALQWSHPAA